MSNIIAFFKGLSFRAIGFRTAMTGRARVHARGRRRDTPPPEPAQPEAVRGRPVPPVPRTDPPLSFADLVRRGTAAVSSLALFPLCKNAAFPEKREIGCSAGIAPLLLWSSLLPRERTDRSSREELDSTAGLPVWAGFVSTACFPFLCVSSQVHTGFLPTLSGWKCTQIPWPQPVTPLW